MSLCCEVSGASEMQACILYKVWTNKTRRKCCYVYICQNCFSNKNRNFCF